MTLPDRRFTDRSAPARAAILAAARSRFAADGYEKATIRAIAADAGIDASMVIRYYGSKAELFEASAAIDLALRETVPTHEGPERVAEEYGHAFMSRWESGTNEVELGFGPSIGIGNVFLEAGVHYGRPSVLGGGFRTGDTVFKDLPLPVTRAWTTGFAFSILYRIPLK